MESLAPPYSCPELRRFESHDDFTMNVGTTDRVHNAIIPACGFVHVSSRTEMVGEHVEDTRFSLRKGVLCPHLARRIEIHLSFNS